MNGVGADEIVAETPQHDRSLHELEVNEIADVIRTYVARILDLERDKRFRYVLIFKNHGEEAGAHTITHSRLLCFEGALHILRRVAAGTKGASTSDCGER